MSWWSKVDERMPPLNTLIIAATRCTIEPVSTWILIKDEQLIHPTWYKMHDCGCDEEVDSYGFDHCCTPTHWMPLPEKPEEDEYV